MAVTAKRARTLALSLEDATSYPHFDRIAFRTPRRTFATLALHGGDLNFMFDLVQQSRFCKLAPHAITPVAGGWGRMGATRCDLTKIDAATFTAALKAAHARANTPSAKRKRVKAGVAALNALAPKPTPKNPKKAAPPAAKPRAAKRR
jgi:hypothetical protein